MYRTDERHHRNRRGIQYQFAWACLLLAYDRPSHAIVDEHQKIRNND
jgi:hypothetical protein